MPHILNIILNSNANGTTSATVSSNATTQSSSQTNVNTASNPAISCNATANSNNTNGTQSNSNINTAATNTNANGSANAQPKDKKRSTILPWTKAFIKWKRLSGDPQEGKDKKSNDASFNSSIKGTKTAAITSVTANSGAAPSTTSQPSQAPAKVEEEHDQVVQVPQPAIYEPSKYTCRVICINDGSSTLVNPQAGQTVYQALAKFYTRKQILWYKCDLFFVQDYQPIDQQSDASQLINKEIYLEEGCLFVLSLTSIVINLCIKASFKKTIHAILQPIFDFYQINLAVSAIHLNDARAILNLNEPCSIIDNQHVLVVHKQQSNLLSQSEINSYINVSLNDFIPSNCQDFVVKFDEMGILKQYSNTITVQSRLRAVATSQSLSTVISPNNIGINLQSQSNPNFNTIARAVTQQRNAPNVKDLDDSETNEQNQTEFLIFI